MNRTPMICLTALICSIAVVDVAPAQIFRKVWQRRKSEIKQEVGSSLSAKMDGDLAREIDILTSRMDYRASQLIAAEASKLDSKVQQAIAEMNASASATITAEATTTGESDRAGDRKASLRIGKADRRRVQEITRANGS